MRYDAPDGIGPTLQGDFSCQGGEKTIFECMNKAPGQKCPHGKDQGVVCWNLDQKISKPKHTNHEL